MRLIPVRPERSRVRRNGARERVGGTRGRSHRTGEISAVPVFGRSEHGNGRDGLKHGQAELGSGRHGDESEGGELGNGSETTSRFTMAYSPLAGECEMCHPQPSAV